LQVQNPTTANNLQIQTFKLEDTKMQGVLGSGHIILVAICAAFDNSIGLLARKISQLPNCDSPSRFSELNFCRDK
jgi:hypothetical protein